jgi:hypothetical protein
VYDLFTALLAESACPMICPFNYAPVCGSDGVIYIYYKTKSSKYCIPQFGPCAQCRGVRLNQEESYLRM